jgi:hypothetical protein
VKAAQDAGERDGLADRFSTVGTDFFASVPTRCPTEASSTPFSVSGWRRSSVRPTGFAFRVMDLQAV